MTTLLLFCAALGFCGMRSPYWWLKALLPKLLLPRPRPPIPDPQPGPDPTPFGPRPHPWLTGILSIVGGIAAGYFMHSILPNESFATFGLAAFAGGRIFSDIGEAFTLK
jgi:hypothetical protein